MRKLVSLTSLLINTALLMSFVPVAMASSAGQQIAQRKKRKARRDKQMGKREALTVMAVGDEEFKVWAGSSGLRGAHIWLKIRGRDDYEIPKGTSHLYPTYGLEDFQKLREWGDNYVTLSCPGIFGVGAPHRLDERALSEFKDLIVLAHRAGLYATVAFRTGPLCEESRFSTSRTSAMWNNSSSGRMALGKWIEMWGYAASALKNFPNVVGYELMVEPDAPNPDDWNRLATDIVRKVRENDEVTPVIIGGAAGEGDGSSVDSLKEIGLFDDRYVVYTVHQYRPNAFTQQEKFKEKFEKLLSYGCPPGGMPLPVDAAKLIVNYQDCGDVAGCRAQMQAAFATIDAWREDRRRKTGTLPTVAITEIGVVRWAPGADTFLRDQFEEINARNFSYALWRWGPWRCTGDDEFDLRRGDNFKLHLIDEGAGNKLKAVVIKDWEKNKIFAPEVGPN